MIFASTTFYRTKKVQYLSFIYSQVPKKGFLVSLVYIKQDFISLITNQLFGDQFNGIIKNRRLISKAGNKTCLPRHLGLIFVSGHGRRAAYFLSATVPPTLKGEKQNFCIALLFTTTVCGIPGARVLTAPPPGRRCILPLYWPNNPRYAVTLRIRPALTFSLGRHLDRSLSGYSRCALSNGRLHEETEEGTGRDSRCGF